jgi:pimeloyl-ACP methyl ester carboxylesterase
MEQLIINKRRILYLVIPFVFIITGYPFLKIYSQITGRQEAAAMEKVISKDGTEVSFLRKGTGPPLILVHGTTAEHSRWLPIISHFEKEFTVYAVDRRGRGGSGDSEDYNIIKEVEDISAVINSIDEPVFILGHSYGGLVVLETSLHTDRIKRMILYEPPVPAGLPLYPPDTVEKLQSLIDNNNNEAALEVMLKEVVKMPDYEFEKYRQLPAYKRRIEIAHTIPREITVELEYAFEPGKFKGMKTPTMLLLGGDSPAVFRNMTEHVHSALPNSRIVVMPGQQHIAMDTNTELFVEEVKKFLTE